MSIQTHQLCPRFNKRLEQLLKARGIEPEQMHTLATQVLQLSDFYLQNPGSPTPWQKPFAIDAYLSYFLPLNFIRLKAVFAEVRRFLPDQAFHEIWDFGSGLGTTQWVLESHEDLAPHPLFAIESAREAIDLNRQLIEVQPTQWNVRFTANVQPLPQALGVFSYSFLEMQSHLPSFENFAHLLIVEPSTREQSRSLMQWRDKLMQRGFFPLAPCTHSQACPLLTQSRKDWCHQRVHFSGPDWWQELEDRLPMKNRTLTYSYLLLSRTVQDTQWRNSARVIGDTLEENGKTRQMICRGPQREFLSWLHKHGPAPSIPHGSLVRGVDHAEVRGGDLRPAPGSLEWTEP